MRIKPIKKERCCNCKDKATGYIRTKPYCKICFERQMYEEKLKRNAEKLNMRKMSNSIKS